MLTGKEESTRLIQRQPLDSTDEGIVDELVFYVTAARGLADCDAEYCIPNDEMGRRLGLPQQ